MPSVEESHGIVGGDVVVVGGSNERPKRYTRHRKGKECQCKLNQLRADKKAQLMGR